MRAPSAAVCCFSFCSCCLDGEYSVRRCTPKTQVNSEEFHFNHKQFGDSWALFQLFEQNEQLAQKIHILMSAVTDFAATVQKNFDALSADIDSIQAGITNLDTLIQGFQNSPGTLSAADQAALDAISANSAALVTKANAINVTPPVPTSAQLSSSK